MLAPLSIIFFFFNDTATTEIYTLSPTRRSSDLLRHDSFAAELHDTLSPGVIPAHAQVWLDLPRRPFELVQQPGFGRGHRSLLPLETRNPIESVTSCHYKATFPSSSSRKTLFGPDSQA